MGKKTWFISDLHLDASRPQIFTLLHDFLDSIEGEAEALYILGDLFEFWVGDDLLQAPAGKAYLPIVEHLKKLSGSGVKLYFIQGNRDFLLRQSFMDRIGGTLLPDTHIIDLYGTPTIILHGDTLCTDDKGYQLLRALFRIKLIQWLYLSKSIEKRSQRAKSVRKSTTKRMQKKSTEVLDVNQQAVEKSLKGNQVLQMIHGHTHRPDVHTFKLDGKEAKRIVLGDWHDKASFVVADAKGTRLES